MNVIITSITISLEHDNVALKRVTHVAFPSRIKTQDRDSLRVASTTLTDSGFSVSVRSIWVGVGLAKRFRLMSAEARTLRWPLFSLVGTEVHWEIAENDESSARCI